MSLTSVAILLHLLELFDELKEELAESFGADEFHLNEVTEKSHHVLGGKGIGVENEHLMQRLDNLLDEICCEVKVFNGDEGDQSRVQVDLVGHAVHTSDQSLSDRQSVRLLLKDKSARQLSLELGEVVITVVAHFISNTDNHQLQFVDLTDRLWLGWLLHDRGLRRDIGILTFGHLFLGHVVRLHLCFYHFLLTLMHKSVFCDLF